MTTDAQPSDPAGRLHDDLSAVFLDRDGVINRKAAEGDYVTSWQGFEFLPGVLEALRLLAAAPPPIVVVTNQRGIALGRMSAENVEDIHVRMRLAVARAGGRIDAVYYCPHNGGCRCRKPDVGMFKQAADELALRLERTAVVGDSPSDMLAAARIGATRVLIGDREPREADYLADDLADAAAWLIGADKRP
jgi:D-glycero-D-manno-heptose 1,7-bisphosphate phosphatase